MAYIMACVAAGECCSIVGVSNMGKSVLLRSVCRPEVKQRYLAARADEHVFVYIDFNLMLEVTEQGFYELVLRNLLSELARLGPSSHVRDRPPSPPILGGTAGQPLPQTWGPGGQVHPQTWGPGGQVHPQTWGPGGTREIKQGLLDRLDDAYRNVVSPANQFMVPLNFNESMIAICEGLGRRVVLLFDEFDEAFRGIDERVFLNLRALRDKYRDALCYVAATEHRLQESRSSPEIAEFCELFAHHVRFLGVLNRDDAVQSIDEFARREGLDLGPSDVDFVIAQSGGHPGLLEVVCRLLGDSLRSGEAQLYSPEERHRLLEDRLGSDLNVRTECAKLWNDLTTKEQDALVAFLSEPSAPLGPKVRRSLREKSFLIQSEAGQLRPFGRLFAGFAHRQRLVKGPLQGVRVDVDAGEVRVDGQLVPALTNLEYRLLLLLYGHLDKICTKYQIVEAVWGAEYIEAVDDARIEKLVGRLRQKIEPEPSNPCYVVTVRGRGYKLVSS